LRWQTRLAHPAERAGSQFRSLAYPVYRGSTVLFERQSQVVDDWDHQTNGYTYGLYGTPTVLELGARIAELEGALHSFLVPGGQAAIALVYFAFCRAGSHALVPMSACQYPTVLRSAGFEEGMNVNDYGSAQTS